LKWRKKASLEEDSEHGLLGLLKSILRKKTHIGNSSDLTEEIHELMDEGQAKGLISDEESGMVYAVLDLKETRASSIMIPRTEISSASVDATLGEVIKLVNDCGHTRIPIHRESIDQIVGILHAKDLLKLWGRDPLSTLPPEILRRPYFVPERQKVGQLFRDMKEKKTHLAILTDEYGGTAGIITTEDIIEEIVGEILDEHDTEEPLLKVIDESTLVVDARLEIRKLEDHLGIKLHNGEYESVGGFIIHLLGSIPKVDEKITYGDLEITVRKADQRKVDELLIVRRPHPGTRFEESVSRD
jgi:CBS domain containing-hemolysin-like protein